MKEINTRLAEEKAALQDCENQVLHDIDVIQPYGYLLGADFDTLELTHASQNCEDWFSTPCTSLLGKVLEEIFPNTLIHGIRNAIGHSTISVQREHVGIVKSFSRVADVFLHVKQKKVILELQEKKSTDEKDIRLLDYAQRVIKRLDACPTVPDLLEHSAKELHALSGFNRVKAYQFQPDGAGAIVAESKDPGMTSFLGLRFPAYDIPNAARKLYSTTPIRIIPSINANQIPIIKKENAPNLDLSLAIFRGVVPVHLQYLKNMKVAGTLSLPIVVDGNMWGLFAFHHAEAKMLDSETLSTLELLGSSISMLLSKLIQKKQIQYLDDTTVISNALFIHSDSPLGFQTHWEVNKDNLMKLITSEGVYMFGEDHSFSSGIVPNKKELKALIRKLKEISKENKNSLEPIIIESLPRAFPHLNFTVCKGCLAIENPAPSFQFLIFFRESSNKKISWAGTPVKDFEKTTEGLRLNPRGSFNEYISEHKESCDPFVEDDINIAIALKKNFERNIKGILLQKSHRNRLGLIIRELNHRVRNTLALVSSLITQSNSDTHTLESYTKILSYRIQALAETQNLLTEYNWNPLNLKNLMERSLLPYKEKLYNQILFEGEEYFLQTDFTSLFSLVINELGANASKYGSLSTKDGIVNISWSLKGKNLILEWNESGGPLVSKPNREGFGTSLITQAIPYEYGGHVNLEYHSSGLSVVFTIPADKIISEKGHGMDRKRLSSGINDSTSAKVIRILVLEDDFVVGQGVKKSLTKFGITNIDLVSSIENALSLLDTNYYDFAILDVNIRGKLSIPVADKTNEKEIPFIFVTGYGKSLDSLADKNSLGIITKPITDENLKMYLEQANLTLNE